jgi:hypothetical protein
MKRTNETGHGMAHNDFLEVAVDVALFDFWAKIAELYPEVKTGDLGPAEVISFTREAEHVVYAWLENNLEGGLHHIDSELIACMRREEVAFHMNKSTERVYWDAETWRNLKSRMDFLDKEEHVFLFAWDSEYYWPGTAEVHNYRWMSSNEDLLLGDKSLIADLRVGQQCILRDGFTVTRLS